MEGQGFGFGFSSNFSDIIDEMFGDLGGEGDQSFQQTGSDIRFNLDISLKKLLRNKCTG